MLHWHGTGVDRSRAPGYEGQGLSAQNVLDKCRVDIRHTVAETGIGAGHAVMQFVRVQHKRISRDSVTQRTFVVKALHPCEGSSDRVSVVTMWVIAMASKPRLDTFHPAG